MANIQKRPDGRWRARYRDPDGKEHARHFQRRVDAQRWLEEVTTSLVTGAYVDPRAGRATFASYYREWAERQLWETTTLLASGLAARTVTFAELPLKDLRRSHIESWIKLMSRDGLAPGTVRTRFNNVRSVLRAAVRDRVIPVDPSEGVTLPRRRRNEAAMTLPAGEQVAAILTAVQPEYRAFVAIAAFAGLRLGEVAGLQVGDVNFLRRELAVERQVQRAPGGAVEVRPPKYGSERRVYLADGLVELLARHIEQHSPGDDPRRWLFEASPGQPPHQNTVGYHWRRGCRGGRCQAG